jgi:hypothetical protein
MLATTGWRRYLVKSYLAAWLLDRRLPGSYPETAFEEIRLRGQR